MRLKNDWINFLVVTLVFGGTNCAFITGKNLASFYGGLLEILFPFVFMVVAYCGWIVALSYCSYVPLHLAMIVILAVYALAILVGYYHERRQWNV